jgi:hypothetical protein
MAMRMGIFNGAVMLALSLATHAGEARAANVTTVTQPHVCTLLLDGLVQDGDVDRLKSALAAVPAGAAVNLCLNGQGGSFTQALHVVEWIASAGRPIRTIVDRGAGCYSACALIFMAGRNAEGNPDRKLHVRGTLGFHAPFIKPGAADYDVAVVERAHREALRALSRFLEINSKEFFPEELLINSLVKQPHEFQLVETTVQAGRWKIDLFGYRKPKQISENMLLRACKNDMEWSSGMENGHNDRSNRPITFKNRRFRVVIPDFGDEGGVMCVADVYSDPAQGFFLGLMFAGEVTDEDVPKPNELEAKAKAQKDPLAVPGKPLWYLFSPETKLKELPEQ